MTNFKRRFVAAAENLARWWHSSASVATLAHMEKRLGLKVDTCENDGKLLTDVVFAVLNMTQDECALFIDDLPRDVSGLSAREVKDIIDRGCFWGSYLTEPRLLSVLFKMRRKNQIYRVGRRYHVY